MKRVKKKIKLKKIKKNLNHTKRRSLDFSLKTEVWNECDYFLGILLLLVECGFCNFVLDQLKFS